MEHQASRVEELDGVCRHLEIAKYPSINDDSIDSRSRERKLSSTIQGVRRSGRLTIPHANISVSPRQRLTFSRF
jgi:hypothetical protein